MKIIALLFVSCSAWAPGPPGIARSPTVSHTPVMQLLGPRGTGPKGKPAKRAAKKAAPKAKKAASPRKAAARSSRARTGSRLCTPRTPCYSTPT